MACTLTITDVTGITTGGALTSIVVSGTSINCTSVTVLIQCGPGPGPSRTVAVDTSTNPPTWTVTFPNVPAGCACTKQISVTARCADNIEDCLAELTGALECTPGGEACPSITLTSISIGDDCHDGTRTVQVHYQLNGNDYSAELVDSGGTVLATLPPGTSGMGDLSGSGNYTGGTETFTVNVMSPPGCPGSSFSVGIPACVTCPAISWETNITPIPDSPGQNTVTVKATLTPTSPTQQYAADLREAGTTLRDLPLGTGQRDMSSDPESLPDGSQRTYEVVITSPSGCPSGQNTATATATAGNGNGNGSFGCDGLLWTAFVLISTGLVLGVIAICTVNVPLGVGAGITLAVGLILLVLWLIFCARFSGCETLRTINCILKLIIAYGWIIVLVLAFLHSWACGAAAAAAWGSWALVRVVIEEVQDNKNCPEPRSCSVLPPTPSGP